MIRAPESPQRALVCVSTRRSPGSDPAPPGSARRGTGPARPRARSPTIRGGGSEPGRQRGPCRPPLRPPAMSGPGGSGAPHRTYLDLLACCVVGRGHATRRRVATSPRAASVATHRPPPAEGPPPLPQSSPEVLRRRSRLFHFRPTLGVADKYPRRLPHHLLSASFLILGTRFPLLGMRRNRAGGAPRRWPRRTRYVSSWPQAFG